MAEKVESSKGFKILRMSREEVSKIFDTIGICDRCNKIAEEGYYVSVLNMWFCPECYKNWHATAVHYEEDKRYEDICYERVKQMLADAYD